MGKLFIVLVAVLVCDGLYAMDDTCEEYRSHYDDIMWEPVIRESTEATCLDPFPCDMTAIPSIDARDLSYNAYRSVGLGGGFYEIILPMSTKFSWLTKGCVRVSMLLNSLSGDFHPRAIELKTNGVFSITCCNNVLHSKASFYEHLELHRCCDRSLRKSNPRLRGLVAAEIVFCITSSSGLIDQLLKYDHGEAIWLAHMNQIRT